jgi:F-type H+-transporting ATPase subunit b
MQIVSNIALISINETLIVQLVSFLIFLFILNRVMIRPLRKVSEERQDYIGNIETDISEAEQEFERIRAEIAEKEQQARREAFALQEEIEAAGALSAGEIIDRTKSEIAQLRDEAQKELEGKLNAARQSIRSEAETLSISIMEKLLNRRLRS